MNEAPTVIVLAAGEGKRMRSALPKVLHPLLGRTLLGHVLARRGAAGRRAARWWWSGTAPTRSAAHVAEIAPDAQTVLQAEQHGTGHAVRIALDAAPDVDRHRRRDLRRHAAAARRDAGTVLASHASHAGPRATVLTAEVADPTGLGPDRAGRRRAASQRIVEQRDATRRAAARSPRSTPGIYAFDADALRDALGKLSTRQRPGRGVPDRRDRAAASRPVTRGRGVYVADDPDEALGCNDRAQLAGAAARCCGTGSTASWMRAGVTMIDPATTWIDVTVTVGVDAMIEPNTQLRGATVIGAGAVVGPGHDA